jgi:hypothetical protein
MTHKKGFGKGWIPGNWSIYFINRISQELSYPSPAGSNHELCKTTFHKTSQDKRYFNLLMRVDRDFIKTKVIY